MAYLIGAIIGAIIGLFTNWLAIKMLFKPHTEKRIAGIKLPFTPGLIPKEKERIAKSVAESVGEHLINQESISNSLNKEEVKNKIKNSVSEKVKSVLSEEGTLEIRLKTLFNESYEKAEIKLEQNIYNKISSILKDEEKQEQVANYLICVVEEKLKKEPIAIVEYLNKIDLDIILQTIVSNINENELHESLESGINDIVIKLKSSDKIISDVIPKKAMKAVEDIIYKNKEKIAFEICNTLKSDEVSEKIKRNIISKLLGGFGGMVAMFVSVDGIYDKFVNAIEVYLKDEENARDLCSYIVTYLNKFSDMKVSEVLDNMPEDVNKEIAVFVADNAKLIFTNKLFIEKLKSKIISYVNGFDSYHDMILSFDKDYESKVLDFVKKTIDGLAYSKQVDNTIKEGIKTVKKEILSYDISKSEEAKTEIISAVDVFIDKNYEKFIEKDLTSILELVNIEEIVETQINSFDVDYAENIILGIANKELRAITYLGGVLGGILGLLSPFLARLQ